MHACASFRFNRSSRTFVDFANFTRNCRTSRKTLLSRRLINLEQAERRTLAYDRLTPGCSTFRKTLGRSLVTVDPTVITLKRLQSSISSRPKAGEVWRVGLACLLYTTPYACMCIDFNRLHRISTSVRLFASTDRVELSSTLRLHTQVSHFAQTIAKSPSDQP